MRSTRPFLDPARTDQEAAYLQRAFLGLGVEGPVVDLGCGHGRHACRLQGRVGQGRAVVGLEQDPLSLREREGAFPAVRADLLRLPFADRSLGGAFAWYSTLFVFEDEAVQALLGELGRCIRPGGLLVLHTAPRERLEQAPTASFEGPLPDGSQLSETSRFDPQSGRDLGWRKLSTPDGRVLSARYFIRYYPLPELVALLTSAGFCVRWIHGGLDGGPPDAGSPDLIMGVERRWLSGS